MLFFLKIFKLCLRLSIVVIVFSSNIYQLKGQIPSSTENSYSTSLLSNQNYSEDELIKNFSSIEQLLSEKIAGIIGQNRFLLLLEQDPKAKRETHTIDSSISLENLPGLPINPWIKRQKEDQTYSFHKKKYFYLFIDTSISLSLVPVFEKLIISSGFYNYKSDDEIVIETIEFPNTFSNLTILNKNTKQNRQLFENDKVNSQLDGSNIEKSLNDVLEILKSAKWLILGFLVILILALLINFIIQFINRKKLESIITSSQRTNQKSSEISGIENKVNDLVKLVEEQKVQFNSLHSKNDLIALTGNKEAYSSEINQLSYNELDNLLAYIQDVFKQNDFEKKRDVAISISESNPGLLNYLRNVLSNQDFFELQNIVYQSKFESPEMKFEKLQNFRDGFLNFRKNAFQKREGLPAFYFLNQLSNVQIHQLVKQENDEIISIVLAQLPTDVSIKVLKLFDMNKQALLIQRMNNINHLSVDFLGDVAKKLNKNALHLKELGDVSTNGLEAILAIIENLPLMDQDKYIENISKYDIQLAREIQEKLVTIGTLKFIPKSELSKHLQNVNPNTMAQFKGILPEEVYQYVLTCLSIKDQELIESESRLTSQSPNPQAEVHFKELLKQLKSKVE